MSRSKWKGNFIVKENLLKTNKNTLQSRRSTIPLYLEGKFANISTGKEIKRIYISKEKVGLKFGTFVYTRKGKPAVKLLRKK